MKVIITLILIIAISMALTVTLTMKNIDHDGEDEEKLTKISTRAASKRLSRFLAEDQKPKNPRAADHCKKDKEMCGVMLGTCCSNKCVDLKYDWHNCGACKKKCLVTQSCCRGECVNLSYDKRHCGMCNSRCMPGGYCIYGICDYA